MADPNDGPDDDGSTPFDVSPSDARRHEQLARQGLWETAWLRTQPTYRHRLHIVKNDETVIACYVMDEPETLN